MPSGSVGKQLRRVKEEIESRRTHQERIAEAIRRENLKSQYHKDRWQRTLKERPPEPEKEPQPLPEFFEPGKKPVSKKWHNRGQRLEKWRAREAEHQEAKRRRAQYDILEEQERLERQWTEHQEHTKATQMRNIVFDSQILSSLQKCPYYLNLAFIRRLGVEHKAMALESGDLLHTMMKVFYTLKIRRPDLPYEQYIEHAKQIGREKAITLSQELETSEEVSYHFEEYCKFREGEFWIPKRVEDSFTILLHESEEDNLRIYYEGIVDLVVDSEAGEAVVDHKSSRRNIANPNVELSNQFMGYCYSLNINTAVINKVGFQKTLKPKDRFTRVPLSYSSAQLQAWKENTIWWAKQLAWFVDNNTFPQNFTGCDKYSGCIFGEACKTDPGAAREWILENHFKELPKWNPHTRDAELDERIAKIVQEA